MVNPDLNNSLERPNSVKNVKVVLVGPEKCGKTALVERFVNDIFSDNYTTTSFQAYSKKCDVGEFTVQFSIWDTSGINGYDNIRPLAYQDANVFLLCFNIGDPESLDLAIYKWFSEIKSHCPTTPIVLCGCQADVREQTVPEIRTSYSSKQSYKIPIVAEQAIKASSHISAIAYVETSSIYENNKAILNAFEITAEAALGTFYKHDSIPKKKNHNDNQSPSSTPIKNKNNKNKVHLTNELKGLKGIKGKKGCCVM